MGSLGLPASAASLAPAPAPIAERLVPASACECRGRVLRERCGLAFRLLLRKLSPDRKPCPASNLIGVGLRAALILDPA